MISLACGFLAGSFAPLMTVPWHYGAAVKTKRKPGTATRDSSKQAVQSNASSKTTTKPALALSAPILFTALVGLSVIGVGLYMMLRRVQHPNNRAKMHCAVCQMSRNGRFSQRQRRAPIKAAADADGTITSTATGPAPHQRNKAKPTQQAAAAEQHRTGTPQHHEMLPGVPLALLTIARQEQPAQGQRLAAKRPERAALLAAAPRPTDEAQQKQNHVCAKVAASKVAAAKAAVEQKAEAAKARRNLSCTPWQS